MHYGAQLLLNREIQSYKTGLMTWSARIEMISAPMDAFRMASQKPALGHLAASMRSMTNSDRMRAEARVERKLQAIAEALPADDPQILHYMRAAQGHWPKIHRILDEKRRSATSKT
jgi:hypothetical protein